MGRKNHRQGRVQARRNPFADLPAPVSRPLERMPRVQIVGRCPAPRQRLRYATRQTAEEALTIVRRERLAKGHPESGIEKRVYECEIAGCGGWHLTSRTVWNKPPGRES